MSRRRLLILAAMSAVLATGALALYDGQQADVALLQRQVSPGRLSAAHASLERNCAACHTPAKSAEGAKCIGCHVGNTALLQRQSTAFHATVGTCRGCHVEHQGLAVRPVTMTHAGLADIGLKSARQDADNETNRRLLAWMRQHDGSRTRTAAHPRVTTREAALDCASCHGTKDRHQSLFGRDCASCHATAAWTIPEFKHPSASSVNCVQCHQAPPSHSMMHFDMVSRNVARRPDARVDQCYQCHQTTSWNDIRGLGWYKHH
ncbi:MAG: cytochrome c3 family protein [Gemmatimonadaceae bacterium]|uniref:cytochrome c3 family protein n=1 Tax=Gemmatimonas sp. UBA7669 TaxID=1946568 RepID=UPI0025BDADA3|nr:cytochrome c3 family protein [Gemmatimonas sp. UBA7669]MBX9854860.1 cytochrome c3 family protein [Gemmatimonadaceae bacterium]